MVKKVIKLGAAWCQPCKAFSKVLKKVAEDEKYQDISFNDYDVEEDEEGIALSDQFGVRSVPTTLILDENNQLITKVMGATNEASFKATLNHAMGEDK